MFNSSSISKWVRSDVASEGVRFGVTGVLNTFWCLAILYVLNRYAGWPVWLSSWTGYAIATVHSFLLNKYWTFSRRQGGDASVQFASFVALNVVGSIVFSAIVSISAPVLGLTWSAILGTCCTTILNFAVTRAFIFRGTYP
ncbi:MAG: GtrA family protein [Sphingomonadales bacterium]|nr:MAG: GtrA family protein [Sphingomonadales bacterium]TNF02100.1 MAG: GtrA family protein [Sphingomonadales bacterium]